MQMQQQARSAKPIIKYDNVMLDLETLGLTADSVILSIGAVKFNMDGAISDEAFYAVCDVDSQRNRHINGDTLGWWIGQGESAKAVFTDPRKEPLFDALCNLAAFFDRDDYLLWSNGADFDIPMVNHALRTNDIAPLVKHWCHRCFRTLKEENKHVPKPEFIGTQHNALMDAIYQAKWAQAIRAHNANPPPAKGFAAQVVK